MSQTIRTGALIAGSALFIWIGGFAFFVFYAYSLKIPDVTERTQAIVVLTGGPGRIDTGLTLLSAGSADHLFISGVDERVDVESIVARAPTDIEISHHSITLGYKARNTMQNAEEVRDWAERENIKSFRLVTARYHMPRAFLEVSRALPPKTKVLQHAVSGQGTVMLLLEEYHKTIWTWAGAFFKQS